VGGGDTRSGRRVPAPCPAPPRPAPRPPPTPPRAGSAACYPGRLLTPAREDPSPPDVPAATQARGGSCTRGRGPNPVVPAPSPVPASATPRVRPVCPGHADPGGPRPPDQPLTWLAGPPCQVPTERRLHRRPHTAAAAAEPAVGPYPGGRSRSGGARAQCGATAAPRPASEVPEAAPVPAPVLAWLLGSARGFDHSPARSHPHLGCTLSCLLYRRRPHCASP
jgi:translation initiation factor IF-2